MSKNDSKRPVSNLSAHRDGAGSRGPFPAALAVVLLAYGLGLNGPFEWDDLTLPFRLRGYGRELGPWLSGMRPATMLSYWPKFRICGLDPLHPLGTEAVTYITGRSDVLSAFFFFLAGFALFVSKLRQEITVRLAAAVVALFGIACLSKESAAVFPAIIIVTDVCWNRERLGHIVRQHWRLYATAAAAAAGGAVFVWSVLQGASSADFGMADVRWPDYLFTQWRVVWLYVQLFFLPAGKASTTISRCRARRSMPARSPVSPS